MTAFNGRPTHGKFVTESFGHQMERKLNDAVAAYHRNRRYYTLGGERVSPSGGV